MSGVSRSIFRRPGYAMDFRKPPCVGFYPTPIDLILNHGFQVFFVGRDDSALILQIASLGLSFWSVNPNDRVYCQYGKYSNAFILHRKQIVERMKVDFWRSATQTERVHCYH